MDKILQQIGTFLGRKFSKIYTIFNDKYNELDNKKVDKEEGKELMPSPEGASDTVFLSETGWREVNTDKIRTHVISISIPFDSAWDFNGTQEITLEEGDYDRDEAGSFIYDYFRYNNPNVVIRNTNTTAQSAQKGYHTVWKVALDTIAEGRALRLYLDIPENLSFTMAPERDSARFTRYCILLYLSQDEENQTYTLNSIGILPNGTDSFIPRKYLDGKLSDITSSYLPLSGGLMTGNIAFPDGKGLGSAVGQSDLLVRSGNIVKLGSAGFSARLYAENPVVREGLEGMFTMYDTSNLDIDKPFVTDLWAVYDAEGKNTQSIAVDLYNPVAKSATKVYRELLPVTDTNMGLMTPSYKTALDRLIPSSGESLSIYGTPASTWQLTLGTGPKLKNSGGVFELRDNSDNAYTDLILNNITIKGNVTQEGSSFITEAETVEVSDNILLLNRGEVGSGVTKGISGIQVDRGALTDYQFIFDESDDRFKVGVEGDLWPVMLRNNESDLSDKFFLSWDASLKRAVTTNIVPETGLLFSGGVSNHPEYDITVAATGSGSIGFGALQANTSWSCTIGYNLNTRDVPSADILDFATSLNAYRYDKPSVLNMIYFDTYLSPNSIEPYGASSISLTTGSGDDLIHTKGGQNYIIYDSSNLNIEELATKDDISGLGTVYYPYSGRGHMTIGADGRPILANNQGILFNTTSGAIEGIYVTPSNRLIIGGSKFNNIPVDIYNDLNIARILDRSTNYSLLVFTNGGTEDSQYTHIGAEHGTTRIRSGLFDLVHDRGGTLYTVFDGYNFSRNLDTISINSSFNHLPMMAAQIKSGDATTDRGYPIQEAGSLVVIPGTYHGSSQIYGTYSTNRWFVRGGSNSLEDPTAHTPWKELATTNHLSGYLPLSGGTMTGNIMFPTSEVHIVQTLKSTSSYGAPIRWMVGNETRAMIGYHTTGGDGTAGAIIITPTNPGSSPWENGNGLFIDRNKIYFNGSELAKVSQIPSVSNYLPLSGGTLTRTSSGPVLIIKNTSTNKETYIQFYREDSKCGYIGAADANTEDMYLWAYDSRNMFIGTSYGITKLFSGTNNLIHSRNGTEYTILDTYNIAALTIQFNGTTNTTYAPNAAKTVNITPAAIGAAPSSHDHSRLLIEDTRNTALYPNNVGTNVLRAIFTNNMMPTSDYWGGIHVHGWSTDYSSWELVGYNGSGGVPTYGLYFRTGILSNWNSWKRVAFADEIPTSLPASDVYAWAKAPSKPSYSWSEITSKPSTFTPSSHIHTAIQGTYTGSGGSQPPSYVTAGTLRANMMFYNMSEGPYCDWLMMDTYTGSDVPYVTMIGVTKTATPRAFIASGPKGNASTSSWVRKELATVDAIPTTMAWGSITGKPSFATVATSGSYNDLSNRPSIPSAETAATIMSKINSQSEITFSKHVVCSAGAGTSSTSDIRFKNNITPLAPVLSHVLGSPGFFYTWKDEDEVLVGTSAQYWEDRITGLVREINDESKTKTFYYERYTVILQEALKEEHMLREAEKEEYRKEICSLREELEDLKKLIQKLL